MMKHSSEVLCIAALAAISFSPCSSAQEETTPAKPVSQASGPDYCSMNKIIGAKVRMNPGAEAKREAQSEGETAKRPEGKIEDVLVDAHTGALQHAVISFGGFVGIGDKTVAVPVSSLTWNQAFERYDLEASEDRLKALPAFDVGKARKTSLDNACAAADVQWRAASSGEVKEASGEKGEAKEAAGAKIEAKAVAGTSFFVIPTRIVCASDIDDLAVYACSEKFGKINDLLVDRGQRSVALAIVKRGGALGIGGTEYLVPFRAVQFCTSGEERVLCMNCEANKLETAVVYEKPKHGVVDPDAAKRALASPIFVGKGDQNKGDNGR